MLAAAEDLEVALRAAFASRVEDMTFFPPPNSLGEYDAIVYVRLNYERDRNPNPNPYANNDKHIGLQYEINDAAGVYQTGFVPLNLPRWPPQGVSSDAAYRSIAHASDELASEVAQALAKMPKRAPARL